MGACGPIPVSRAANPVTLPAAQGYDSTQGLMPAPFFRPVSGPPIGSMAPLSTWIGDQWAPGQGGDTPGGGGAGETFGGAVPVTTSWLDKNGLVVPSALQRHVSGTVGFQGARRGKA